MPQWGNQDYKRAVFEQLAQGSGGGDDDHFQHFENFSSGAPRRDVESGVGEAFHPERLPSDQVEPQFRRAAEQMHAHERAEGAPPDKVEPQSRRPPEQMQPHERSEIAQDLLDELHQRGLAPSWLQRML